MAGIESGEQSKLGELKGGDGHHYQSSTVRAYRRSEDKRRRRGAIVDRKALEWFYFSLPFSDVSLFFIFASIEEGF